MHLTQNPGIYSTTSTLEHSIPQPKPSERILLQKILENFIDGVLILTDRGEWIQANALAQQICEQLNTTKSQPNLVPQEIWRVCQALIENHDFPPARPFIIETELKTNEPRIFRIRVQWFASKAMPHSCLLVILEDRHQSMQNLAIAEINKYGLTRREAEVWLLYRANCTCKDIAERLFISVHTVKKHLKSIKAKQKDFLYLDQLRKELSLN